MAAERKCLEAKTQVRLEVQWQEKKTGRIYEKGR